MGARVQTQINIQIDDFSDIEQTKGMILIIFNIILSSHYIYIALHIQRMSYFDILIGIKPMVFPIMWSSLETDGVRDKSVIERFKEIDI